MQDILVFFGGGGSAVYGREDFSGLPMIEEAPNTLAL